MRLVKIDNFHTFRSERDGSVSKNIFDSGNGITYRLYLNGFDG